MAVGFRKSLFGFNCDDVMRYIEKTHKSFIQKESALKEKAEDLDTALSIAKAEISEINKAKQKLEEELKVYTDKYDEIERLSQNIGKLYLVAQTNSKSIMKSSQEISDLSREEVVKNLTSIEQAHSSLEEIKTEILETSNAFAKKVETLMSELECTRMRINEQTLDVREKIEHFESVYSEISK
ncbi:MAG: hypothetical protein J6J13_04980 [Clostridia bacterium]|nr:hypothetical protein [Clostridia bacterium]